eukprot:12544-Prymnesium_polylepis.1
MMPLSSPAAARDAARRSIADAWVHNRQCECRGGGAEEEASVGAAVQGDAGAIEGRAVGVSVRRYA